MECLRPVYLRDRDIEVPCGKCAFCCSAKRSDWVFRLEYELKDHLYSSFVTLTYAPGEMTFVKGVPQLMVTDLQKFFKRVRKRGFRFRYFACGEYGSHTYRPHYHIIFFGDVPEQELTRAWPKGLIHVGQVTPASVAYCCKYLINSKGAFMRTGRIPPFTTMSRKTFDGKSGGLGYKYLNRESIEWHKSGLKNYVVRDGVKIHLPRYYRDKIFTKRERWIINVRDHRKMMDALRNQLRKMKDRNPLETLEKRRIEFAKRIKNKSVQKLII